MKLGTINGVIAILGSITGLVCVAAGVAVAFNPQEPMPSPIIQKVKYSAGDCNKALTLLGYEPESPRVDVFTVSDASALDPQSKLQKVALASSLCNKRVSEFCMGESCPVPGLSFTLSE